MRNLPRNKESSQHRLPSAPIAGFSLIELLVAMAEFLIAAGAAFSLFDQHLALVTKQENLSGVNIGLRNTISQIEMDLSGAGQNLLSSVPNAPSFSMGVIIQNNIPGAVGVTTCAPDTSTWTYPTASSACFDSIELLSPKLCGAGYSGPNAPYAPVLSVNSNSGNDLSVSSTIFADDAAVGPSDDNTDYGCFSNGDEILVVNTSPNSPCHSGGPSLAYCMTVVTLTKDGSSTGNGVKLEHNPTGASGGANGCPGTSCTDPLGIITGGGYKNALGTGFGTGSYVINLGAGNGDIAYSVQPNASNASDAQLVRNGQPVTDQIIGFKVGADLWDKSNQSDLASFSYNSLLYCNSQLAVGLDCNTDPPPAAGIDPNDFTLVRSIRVSLIGRTPPTGDPSMQTFHNGFDGGPYLVQQASIVVNLRGISIANFQN